MRRIMVLGTSCAGKSTLARQLAARRGIPHVELDDLYWQPNWTPAADAGFRLQVSRAVAQPAWVIDGNYATVRDLVWDRADTLIWLDYSFPVIFTRALVRTFRRSFRGETCCNMNRETFRRAFSQDSILLWVWKTYRERRAEFLSLLPHLAAKGRRIEIFRSPAEAERWLKSVC